MKNDHFSVYKHYNCNFPYSTESSWITNILDEICTSEIVYLKL